MVVNIPLTTVQMPATNVYIAAICVHRYGFLPFDISAHIDKFSGHQMQWIATVMLQWLVQI